MLCGDLNGKEIQKRGRRQRGRGWLLGWLRGKESSFSAADAEMQVQSLGQEDPLEEGMAPYSSTLAWRIPWTEELGGLCPLGGSELDLTETT